MSAVIEPMVTLAAALASGRPMLHVLVHTEGDVDPVLAAIEAIVGPAPQADVFEPFDEGPVEVRVLLPGLDLPTWERLWAALDPLAVELSLVPALPPGTQEAIDVGLLLPEPVHGDRQVLHGWVDAEDGGMLRLERVRTRGDDPELALLARELTDAVRAIDPAIALRSDRGPDTVQPFVHPHSGRYGVEVFLDGTAWDDRPGDEVLHLRARVADAVGEVIAHRARGDGLVLAADPHWELGFGMVLLLWVAGPPGPAWPLDADLSRPMPALEPLLPMWSTMVERVEIQIVTALAHAVLAERVAGADGMVPLAGGRPRWVRHEGQLRFAAVWDAPVLAGLDDVVEALRAIDGVHAVRAVPADPFGYGGAACAEPGWWPCAEGVFLRLHDGRTDRDALPAVRAREPEARDVAAMAALIARCAHLPEDAREPRAVADSAGRPGIEVHLPAEVRDERVLAAWIDALGGSAIGVGGALWTFGWRADGPVAIRWWPFSPDRPPAWGTLGAEAG